MKPKHAIFRNSSQPPKGMHINHDDLVGLATGPVGQGEALLRAHDREIVSYKRLVQNNKQSLASLRGRRKARDRECEPYRVPEAANRINARWTNEELLLAVQGERDVAFWIYLHFNFQACENLVKTLQQLPLFWELKLIHTCEAFS